VTSLNGGDISFGERYILAQQLHQINLGGDSDLQLRAGWLG
jgi:hypothetical protein